MFVDFIVDIRVGSPTFGQWDSVVLDTVDRRAVYLSEGLGHALACIEDGTSVYLCSEVFAPSREHGLTPVDDTDRVALPDGFVPILSDKDTGRTDPRGGPGPGPAAVATRTASPYRRSLA